MQQTLAANLVTSAWNGIPLFFMARHHKYRKSEYALQHLDCEHGGHGDTSYKDMEGKQNVELKKKVSRDLSLQGKEPPTCSWGWGS